MKLKLLLILAYIIFPTFFWAYTAKESFILNKGQWHVNVQYKSGFSGGSVFLENTGFTYVFYSPKFLYDLHLQEHDTGDVSDVMVPQHALKTTFVGANTNSKPVGKNKLAAYYNYFIGNDPKKWAGDVSLFEEVNYQNLYEGIDLRTYFQQGSFKYDFIIAANQDAQQIQVLYDGADELCIKNNELYISTSVGEIIEESPVAYQIIGGKRYNVACVYSLTGSTLSFAFPQGYNTSQDLIIDPGLVGSTYSGTASTVYGHTATYDNQGNIFGGGRCFGSSYPTTTGAFQTSFGGDVDICLSKYSPDATTLIFATYIGGGNADIPHSLVVTDFNEIAVMGSTQSNNFPVGINAFDSSYNGQRDLTLTILKSTGNTLIGSTYIGGSGTDGENPYNLFYEDSYRGEVIFTTENNASYFYVASVTNSSNFPTQNPYKATISGNSDAVIFKMNSDVSQMIWGTYFGGGNNDSAFSLRVAENSSVYFTGATSSNNIPTNNNTIAPNFMGGSESANGDTDAFVARLSANGNALERCSYLGTTSFDQAYFIDLDTDERVFVFGLSKGNISVTPGVYNNANGHMFVYCLDQDFTSSYWQTRLGGGGNNFPKIAPTAFRVDLCGNIYAGGYILEGTSGFSYTPDAVQTTAADSQGEDFYLIVLEKDAADIAYGTLFGGNGWEHVDGGTSRFDNRGIVYQAVCTNSDNFNTTPGAYDSDLNTGWDLFVFKFDFEKSIVNANPSVDADVLQDYYEGCVPFTVFFYQQHDTSTTTNYYWDFGIDGATSNLKNPLYTYLDPGEYDVRLVVVDSTTCNITDTAYVHVNAGFSEINSNIGYQIGDICNTVNNEVEVTFYNQTIGDAEQNYWNFGNFPLFIENDNDTISTYYTPGTYEVSLVSIDSLPCYVVDTSTISIIIPEPTTIAASFSLPNGDCAPYNLTVNSDNSAQNYLWNFGDGTQAQDSATSHQYTQAGTYNVQLLVSDNTTCNISDSVSYTLEVYTPMHADFSVSADTLELDEVVNVIYTGTTPEADLNWDFGDGSTDVGTTISHAFSNQGVFSICLYANSIYNCNDYLCKEVYVNSNAVIDVPNAFSPNGDKLNDILFVEGSGVQSMNFKVFNRWGELVFETDDIQQGWDGNDLRGSSLENDVYTFFLEADLVGIGLIQKVGNITLLK
ncbi:MAG: PKD domain-containing protein [Bacteroidetes bacterium]|nr:PKD domain-containing protein [Bacteroidota bacterium]